MKPETPEEIEAFKKNRRIVAVSWLFSIIFYTTIFIVVPKTPDSDFYLNLDAFISNYSLGYIEKAYSENFYFNAQVAWSFVLIYEPIKFLVLLVIRYFYLRPNGIRIVYYLACDDIQRKTVIAMIFFLYIPFYVTVDSYAFVSSTGAGAYGNFPELVFKFYLGIVVMTNAILEVLNFKFLSLFIKHED